LEKYLPGNIGNRDGCKSFQREAKFSPETDIHSLLINFPTPFLLKEEHYQVFPVECVYGIIETKKQSQQSGID